MADKITGKKKNELSFYFLEFINEYYFKVRKPLKL